MDGFVASSMASKEVGSNFGDCAFAVNAIARNVPWCDLLPTCKLTQQYYELQSRLSIVGAC